MEGWRSVGLCSSYLQRQEEQKQQQSAIVSDPLLLLAAESVNTPLHTPCCRDTLSVTRVEA